jgi:aryl-alcohol dehydrogenase-like predicted oxidoreductase
MCGFSACPIISASSLSQLNEALDAYNKYTDISELSGLFEKILSMQL